ncbi:hypothetical protein [Trinickia dinghuensis]|uniref:hypothetical protein n=1 Tax=Trinickia dinghuensis TaxID=2291023 RepID=UPI001FE51BAD|nr:hypothetical protein [Trinickia dinghuensis]
MSDEIDRTSADAVETASIRHEPDAHADEWCEPDRFERVDAGPDRSGGAGQAQCLRNRWRDRWQDSREIIGR